MAKTTGQAAPKPARTTSKKDIHEASSVSSCDEATCAGSSESSDVELHGSDVSGTLSDEYTLTPRSPQMVGEKVPVLCNYFLRGACTKGAACRFTHGEHELQVAASTAAASRHGLKKTQLCSFFKFSRCLSGSHCLFAHGEEELRQPGHASAGSPSTEAEISVSALAAAPAAVIPPPPPAPPAPSTPAAGGSSPSAEAEIRVRVSKHAAAPAALPPAPPAPPASSAWPAGAKPCGGLFMSSAKSWAEVAAGGQPAPAADTEETVSPSASELLITFEDGDSASSQSQEDEDEDDVWSIMPWWTPHIIAEEAAMVDEEPFDCQQDLEDKTTAGSDNTLATDESDQDPAAPFAAKVHRWDAEHGKWIVEFIEIEDVPSPPDHFAHEHSGGVHEKVPMPPKMPHFQSAMPPRTVSPWAQITADSVAQRALVETTENAPWRRTPLRKSAAIYTPIGM